MKKNSSLIIILTVFLASLLITTYFIQKQQANNRTMLSVYVPCGLTLPFKELSLVFEAAHRDVKIEATFDNTVVLTKLVLKKQQRPDLFVSPGEKEIWLLRKQNLLDESSIKTFGKYELILIAPASAKDINNLQDIFKESVKIFTVANPDYNSVGSYSILALTKLGYWDTLQKSKFIMFTNTPIEALSFIATNKADAGIHYDTCPFETESGKVPQGAIKVIAKLPSDSHPPIYNYISILNESKNKDIARSFIDFIFSKKGKKILAKYGLKDSSAAPTVVQNQANAKVRIEAYYPFNEEHLFIKEYLETLPQKFNGQVKVECIDFRSDKGYLRWRKTGLSCGGILINGKEKFTITEGGQRKEIEFLKRMDMSWTKDELEAAIKQELERK